MMKTLLCILLILAAMPAFGDSLTVTQTPESVQVKKGEAVPVNVAFANTLTPRAPITLNALIDYTNEYGMGQTATSTTLLYVIQPVTVRSYAVLVGSCGYILDSGVLDGQPIKGTLAAGLLSFEVNRTLLEGESITLGYSLRAQ